MKAKTMEEYSIWADFKDNNSHESFQELVIKYLPLVKYHAGRIKMQVPGFIEEDDLISYGILGLIDAINKFDYNKGVLFKTYASRRIRGEILDHLRKLDWLPHSIRRESKNLKETANKLRKKLGRQPTIDELSDISGIGKDRIKELEQKIQSSEWVSLFDEFEEIRLIDRISGYSEEEPENSYDKKLKEEILASAIDRLSKDEKLVISLLYFEELTQKEIAVVMELSAARVSQIHRKAVNRLRGMLNRERKDLF